MTVSLPTWTSSEPPTVARPVLAGSARSTQVSGPHAVTLPSVVLPADDSPLARYLLARLFDSWANASATRFLTLTMADDIDLDHTTRRELAALYQRIDGGEPAPLGLISARTLAEVGYCHQVLAVGYERLPDGTVVVYTWDNNHADAMTTLTLRPDRLGVVSNQRTNPYRGLFVHTYAARTPPDDLSAG